LQIKQFCQRSPALGVLVSIGIVSLSRDGSVTPA
jgi:hypothetical protein